MSLDYFYPIFFSRGSIHFGPEVYSSQSLDNLPFVEIGSLSDEIFASYSGPDDGLAYVVDEKENGIYVIFISSDFSDLVGNRSCTCPFRKMATCIAGKFSPFGEVLILILLL